MPRTDASSQPPAMDREDERQYSSQPKLKRYGIGIDADTSRGRVRSPGSMLETSISSTSHRLPLRNNRRDPPGDRRTNEEGVRGRYPWSLSVMKRCFEKCLIPSCWETRCIHIDIGTCNDFSYGRERFCAARPNSLIFSSSIFW